MTTWRSPLDREYSMHVGSNPDDVARELDTMTAALLSNRPTED